MTSREVHPLPQTGEILVVRREDGRPRGVVVVQLKGGLIWISSSERPGEPDEVVLLEHPVDGDACYSAPARVVFVPPETFALRRIGGWQRSQRRHDVRVRTPGLELAVLDEPAPDPEKLAMLDLSVGGVAGRGAVELMAGEAVRCRFELPGAGPFELPARVVRSGAATPHGRAVVAFRFEALDEEERSELLRWIFREQLRRHQRSRR